MPKLNNFTLCLMVALLAGCSQGNNTSDLSAYIANLKKQVAKSENLIDKFTLRKPTTYTSEQTKSAFPQQNLAANPALMNQLPLERYPIDALNLLGTIESQGQYSAIILAPDGKVYEVKPGDQIGSQHGKISSISENQVAISEPQDIATGTLTARTITLRLKDQ